MDDRTDLDLGSGGAPRLIVIERAAFGRFAVLIGTAVRQWKGRLVEAALLVSVRGTAGACPQ